MASCLSMQSLQSKNPSPCINSVSSYNIPSPDQSLHDLINEIKSKDKTILLLQQRIEELLENNQSKNSQNPEYLHKLLRKGDTKLEDLKERIEAMTRENEALLLKQKELVNIISVYRRENNELKQKLSTSKSEGFFNLEAKLEEIEELHTGLIKENTQLKAEINQLIFKNDEIIDMKFSTISSEIFKVQFEVSQLLKILRVVKSGKELDLNLLLSSQKIEEKGYQSNYQKCSALIINMRRDIEAIKDMIADMKAENYGSNCTTQ